MSEPGERRSGPIDVGSLPALSIAADLRLVVDGTHATVRADGSRITVRTENAGRLLAAATESVHAMPKANSSLLELTNGVAAQLARTLDDSGLSARIVGAHGTVLEMGRGVDSRTERLLRGNPIVLGSASALTWTAAEYAREVVRRHPVRYLTPAVVAALVIASRHLSRAFTSVPALRNG